MLRAQGEGDFADPAKVAGAAHHHGGLGVADEVFDLGALVGGVERQEHVARAQRGQVQGHGFDGQIFFDLHGHAAAFGQQSDASRLAMRALARSRSRQV